MDTSQAQKQSTNFYGCKSHGCRKCKPNKRHVKTFYHPDRTVEEIHQATEEKNLFDTSSGVRRGRDVGVYV